ncbi:MAG: PAS domain S-box protein [Smithellaceae bacterium]
MLLVLAVLCALLVIPLWLRNRRRYDGLHFLALDFSLQAFAISLIVFRGALPDILSVVTGNALIIAGAILGYIGLERFLNKKGPQIHNYLLLAVFIIVQSFFTYIQPNITARLFAGPAALLIICVQCAWLLFHRAEPAMRPVTRDVGLVFIGFSLVSLARMIVLFFYTDVGRDYFLSGFFQTSVLMLYAVLLILLTYTLSLMINKKLLYEIQGGEEKFSKAFHSSPNALSLTHLSDGKILEVNNSFLRMFGYSPDHLSGKTSRELNILYDPHDRDSVVHDLLKHGSVHERELLFRRQDGQILCGLIWADTLTVGNEPCILSSILDITDRKQQQFEREALIEQLQQALADVKTLSGLLPICSSCKKIRDDKGYWNSLEAYLHKHSPARFSHAICPDCTKKLYPELVGKKQSDPEED